MTAETTLVEVRAEIVGNVWKVLVEEGDRVERGATLLVMETMKMEIPVVAPARGVVTGVPAVQNRIVQEGDVVVVVTSS